MVYIDTNILIYLLENHEGYALNIAETVTGMQKNGTKKITSAITVSELIAGNSQINLRHLAMIKGLQIVDLDKVVSEQAGKTQDNKSASIGDAIHLATAINNNCSKIYTNDDRLAKQASKYMKIVKPQ